MLASSILVFVVSDVVDWGRRPLGAEKIHISIKRLTPSMLLTGKNQLPKTPLISTKGGHSVTVTERTS